MNWFYANAGQQAGPINEAEFERLVREGVIQPTTLVWREGMANWEPYCKTVPAPSSAPFAPAALPTPAVASLPPGHAQCHECGKIVPVEDAMQINGVAICAACKPIYIQKMREGTVPFLMGVPSALRYAGFWMRFLAKFIDGIILFAVTFPLGFIFGFRMALNPTTVPDITAILIQQGILTAIGLTVRMLYTWLFVGRFGATPGKMVVGIKVITADGQRVSYARAFGRFWAEMVNGFTCAIGYIIAAFDDQKRALHDHMCSTRVVYK